MYLEVGQETITRQGQLQLKPAHEASGFIAPRKPVTWGAAGDGVKVLLSQHRDVIEARSESLCGVSVPDADRIVPVPVPVFESVDGVEPGAEVGFAANQEMMQQGVMYMVEISRFFDEFPEIRQGTPDKRF